MSENIVEEGIVVAVNMPVPVARLIMRALYNSTPTGEDIAMTAQVHRDLAHLVSNAIQAEIDKQTPAVGGKLDNDERLKADAEFVAQ